MADAETRRPSATIEQQAALIDRIATLCERDDVPLLETFVSITADEAADLRALANRLKRMAPHEAAIKRVVVGR